MRRSARLKQVNDTFGFGSEVQRFERAFGLEAAGGLRAKQLRVQQRRKRKRAQACRAAGQKCPAAKDFFRFKWIEHSLFGDGFVQIQQHVGYGSHRGQLGGVRFLGCGRLPDLNQFFGRIGILAKLRELLLVGFVQNGNLVRFR